MRKGWMIQSGFQRFSPQFHIKILNTWFDFQPISKERKDGILPIDPII